MRRLAAIGGALAWRFADQSIIRGLPVTEARFEAPEPIRAVRCFCPTCVAADKREQWGREVKAD